MMIAKMQHLENFIMTHQYLLAIFNCINIFKALLQRVIKDAH